MTAPTVSRAGANPRRGSGRVLARALSASKGWRLVAKPLAGAIVVAAVVAAVGAEPFVRGLAAISVPAIAAALLLAAIATCAAAWRWRIVAGRVGLGLGAAEAIAAYYRSQFLNTVLPGGIVGDVHRAVAHGRDVAAVPQAARAVAAERTAGQAVQLVLAVAVLAAIGVSAAGPALAVLGVVAALAGVAAVVCAVSRRARAALAREAAMLRVAFSSWRAVLAVVAASVLVLAAHVATFVVACLAVGVTASPDRLATAAIVAVLASAIPFSLGGWGPREGAAAWAFAAVGLGAAAGVAAATAYGVLVMIALTPGAVVAAASVLRRRRAEVTS
ncbi:lysylphosphatidylglycerol synthase domain-containing protein [Microbacterium insulae]|uniref:Lysylphosphatidylglycerol synthase domain-containing protein n=1 Tax=Microbacterium insulae TaxID=483014 RepID=A0ABW3AFH9_9MICO